MKRSVKMNTEQVYAVRTYRELIEEYHEAWVHNRYDHVTMAFILMGIGASMKEDERLSDEIRVKIVELDLIPFSNELERSAERRGGH